MGFKKVGSGSVINGIKTVETDCTNSDCGFHLKQIQCNLGFKTEEECVSEYDKKGGGEFCRRLDVYIEARDKRR